MIEERDQIEDRIEETGPVVVERVFEHSADYDLAARVRRQLWDFYPLRTMSQVQIDARGGTVTFAGVARTTALRLAAEELARRVPGVQEVRSQLVADDELAALVGRALGQNPLTRAAMVRVDVMLGDVQLYGEVSSEAIKAAADEVARPFASGRQLVNRIAVTQR